MLTIPPFESTVSMKPCPGYFDGSPGCAVKKTLRLSFVPTVYLEPPLPGLIQTPVL